MRILLVAYEFPPSPSPQSLRWAYLTRKLQALGHDVHVLAPDLPGEGRGLPDTDGVVVHRTHAGPIVGFIAARSRKQGQADVAGSRELDASWWPPRETSTPRLHLNWKGRLFQRVKAVAGYVTFPDIRGEWRPDRALDGLIDNWRPDVVVLSHEPASTLRLGRKLRDRVAWVADLGDPVLATYTPRRWRRRAQVLEREVWRTAHGVTVTTQAAANLLATRHGEPFGQCRVVPQGYEAGTSGVAPWGDHFFSRSLLEVVYTGSFYGFRDPTAVVEGILRTSGVRLTIASMTAPPELMEVARRYPDQFRLLGFVPHAQALLLQSAADVVLNISNKDPVQIPGKLFEYFGSGRPILHVGPAADQAAKMLIGAGVGWVCENNPPLIAEKLAVLLEDKRAGRLGGELTRDHAVLARYRWEQLAQDYQSCLELALHRFRSGKGNPSLAPQSQSSFQ